MMSIKDYCVIRSTTTGDLSKTVKALIEEGWEPQGGVAVIDYEETDDWWLLQAMILRGTE